MKERPILFSAPMVRAILEGRKTMTRRIINPQPKTIRFEHPSMDPPFHDALGWEDKKILSKGYLAIGLERVLENACYLKCPHGKPGDQLWVRENFKVIAFDPGSDSNTENGFECESESFAVVAYKDGIEKRIEGLCYNTPGNNGYGEIDEIEQAQRISKKKGFTPSIHMPRWASRIDLEVTAVRVERLNDISEEDAKAEGTMNVSFYTGKPISHRGSFMELWEIINGNDTWKLNPWVWVESFNKLGAEYGRT